MWLESVVIWRELRDVNRATGHAGRVRKDVKPGQATGVFYGPSMPTHSPRLVQGRIFPRSKARC